MALCRMFGATVICVCFTLMDQFRDKEKVVDFRESLYASRDRRAVPIAEPMHVFVRSHTEAVDV